MKRTRHLYIVAMILLMCVGLTCCASSPSNAKGNEETDQAEQTVVKAEPQVTMEDGRLTYGEHVYTFDDGLCLDDGGMPMGDLESQRATLTFTHFPASVDEFHELQVRLLGRSLAGCLALNLLSYELFRRDREAGEQCIRLCNTESNAPSVIRMLKEKFTKTRGETTTDSYKQPYLIAAFLKGATAGNQYQPEYPYVLSFYWKASPYARQHERSNFLFGYVYSLNILRHGNKEVSAQVLVPDDEGMVVALNTAGYYFGVPPVKKWDDTLK